LTRRSKIAKPQADASRDSTLATEVVGRDASLALSPDAQKAAYNEKLKSISAEAAALTMPFTESSEEEEAYAGRHSFIDASQKQLVRQVFQFFKELTVPNTSACLLVPDWPRARFNHYLKELNCCAFIQEEKSTSTQRSWFTCGPKELT
jgi:hypothetical protein